MARYVQAIARYGPRVVQGPHAQTPELVRWIAEDSGANVNTTRMVLAELGRVAAQGGQGRSQGGGRVPARLIPVPTGPSAPLAQGCRRQGAYPLPKTAGGH